MKEIYKYSYVIALVLLVASFGEQASAQTKVDSVEELECYKGSRTCYLEGDLFVNSCPSSTNCKSQKAKYTMAVYKDKLYDLKPLRCFDKEIQEERYFLENFRKDTTVKFNDAQLNVAYCKEYVIDPVDMTRKEIMYEGDRLVSKLEEYTSNQKYLYLEDESVKDKVVVDASGYCFERYDRKAYWGAGDEPPVTQGEATWFMDSCIKEKVQDSNELHKNIDGSPVIHEEYADHYYDAPRLANIHHSTKEETNLKFELCERYKDVMIEGVIKYTKDASTTETIKTEAYSDINLVGGNRDVDREIINGPGKDSL